MYRSGAGSNVIPIQRDENCLFCAASYCMHNTESRHSKIRLNKVSKIINGQEYYNDFIVDLSVVNKTENLLNYKNYPCSM